MIEQYTCDNGLTLLIEPMPGVKTVSMTLLSPAGASVEPAGQAGVASVLHEMIFRGAGDMDAREHSNALDHLGVRRNANVGTYFLRLSATMLGERLNDALPLLIDMLKRPKLADDSFEPSRDLSLQSIAALEDEPQDRLMIELRERHMGLPLGRSHLGHLEDLQKLDVDSVRKFHHEHCLPDGAVLSLAGAIEPKAIIRRIKSLTDNWQGQPPELPTPPIDNPTRGKSHHVQADSSQIHIGMAYPAVVESDPEAMTQRMAVAVLSGGMSGRLFTEVREKRGLCYAVHARYASLKDRANVFGYAGTTTERAAETLQVMREQHERLAEGITEQEHHRAKVGLKTRLVMQGESAAARASGMANDYTILGRIRDLDEIAAQVDAVDCDRLNRFVADHRAGPFTIVTVGAQPLDTGSEA